MERERKERPSPVSRELANKVKRAVKQVDKLRDIHIASGKVRLTALEAHNRDITAIAHRGEPFIYGLFYADREIHDFIPTLQTGYEQGVIAGINPSVLKKTELFTQKFKGLSFMDIENMVADPQTHELAPEDIRRINRMFRSQNLLGLGKDKTHAYALETLIYFASQQWTHPEIAVPRSLKKFHDNITAYFDYYTDFMTDFKRDSENENTMLLMLMLGKPYLATAVSSYIPARLNITPSSAIKLYKQRELLAPDLIHKFAWKNLEKICLGSFKQAYRDDAFPEDLAQYQHYSEETDSAATARLLPYMQETATAEHQLQNKDETQNLLEQWNKHKRDITREIMRQPNKRLEYQISQEYPAEDITMVKNRDTFVFIMRFPNDIHLTLELDKTGRLFGIPPSLLKAYPHASDTFIVDLLTPLLEKYKVEDALNVQQSAVRQISVTYLEPPIASKSEIPYELPQEEDQTIKPPKRKRLPQALTIFEPDPLPPTTPAVSKAERFAAYSLDQVRELLGPQISKQQVIINQVSSALRNFEHGHTNGVLLKGSRERIVHIRAGDYRIFLNRLGEGIYTLRTIRHRREAY